jgi:hypothetical protein
MKRSKVILLVALFAAALFLEASSVVADDDPCTESGILVSNGTMLDLWYKKDKGECSFWIHEHVFTIKPEETVKVYSDMDCATLYCPKDLTYKDCKSFDAKGNCGVRIFPNCNLSGE